MLIALQKKNYAQFHSWLASKGRLLRSNYMISKTGELRTCSKILQPHLSCKKSEIVLL